MRTAFCCGFGILGSLALGAVAACGVPTSGSCEETATCPLPADGGTDAGGDVVQPPQGCDPSADPKDSPKCVDDSYGVFVDAANGSDSNGGTRASPLKTIGGALGKLAGKPRVYVCDGTYAEHVKLTAAVSIYGGFACGSWSYSGNKASVAPSDSGYALEVQSVAAAAVIADVSFGAIAGTDASPSSIAAFVNATSALTLRRVALVAGKGAAGKSPAKAANGALMSSTPTAGTLNGNNGGATNGGLAQLCTCVGGGTSKGGGGGNLNGDGSPGETAQAIVSPPGFTGAGGTYAECNSGTPIGGRSGSNAPDAAASAGAMQLGALSETGWIPEPGKNGTDGTAGQGGGGGGGAGGGGGSGACGGCGGTGGQGGGGGGASIALLALNSPVTITACTLTAADAGAGGAGGAGGDGIAGGTKGTQGGGACAGGNGGKGGNGGAGGGGAGGISVGVLSKGGKPTLDSATIVGTGALGAKGTGPSGNDGVAGQKADTLEIQ